MTLMLATFNIIREEYTGTFATQISFDNELANFNNFSNPYPAIGYYRDSLWGGGGGSPPLPILHYP